MDRGRPRTPQLRRFGQALLAGAVLVAAIGSCELPKPKIPSLGTTPAPVAVAMTRQAAVPLDGIADAPR